MVVTEITSTNRRQINNQLRRAWVRASYELDLFSETVLEVRTLNRTIKIAAYWLPDVMDNIEAIAKENA